MKLCIYCKHWSIEYESKFSSRTPGEGFISQCNFPDNGRWHINGRKVNENIYRKCLETGLTCPDFEEDKDN